MKQVKKELIKTDPDSLDYLPRGQSVGYSVTFNATMKNGQVHQFD